MISKSLRHFLATYERRSVTAAADEVCISQPALTRSLKALEDHLGVSLFERLPGGMVPTPYGDLLSVYAKRIHQDLRNALMEIEAMRGGVAGQIRIGAGPVWAAHYLPKVIAKFNNEWPSVRFSIVQATITTMMAALIAGEIDFFCGSLDFPAHPEIETEDLVFIRHVVMTARDHELAGRRSLSPRDIQAFPWLFLAHDAVGRRQLGAFFAAAGVDAPKTIVETSSVACAAEILASGRFLGCQAEPLLNSRVGSTLVALDVERPIWNYTAGIARRSPARPSVAIERFLRELHAMFPAQEP